MCFWVSNEIQIKSHCGCKIWREIIFICASLNLSSHILNRNCFLLSYSKVRQSEENDFFSPFFSISFEPHLIHNAARQNGLIEKAIKRHNSILMVRPPISGFIPQKAQGEKYPEKWKKGLSNLIKLCQLARVYRLSAIPIPNGWNDLLWVCPQ